MYLILFIIREIVGFKIYKIVDYIYQNRTMYINGIKYTPRVICYGFNKTIDIIENFI